MMFVRAVYSSHVLHSEHQKSDLLNEQSLSFAWSRTFCLRNLCCVADEGHCCLLTCPVQVTRHAECIGIGLFSDSKPCFSNKYLIQDANRKGKPLGFVSLKYCTCSPWSLRQLSWMLVLELNTWKDEHRGAVHHCGQTGTVHTSSW